MTAETLSVILMALGALGYAIVVGLCVYAAYSAEHSLSRMADASEDQANALETIAREVVAYSRSRR